MNILVLGHLVLDEIHALNGSVYESAGGITFPLSAFAAVGADDRIVPVFPYGADAADEVRRLAALHANIDISSCREVPEANTRVRLFHDSASSYNTQLVRSLGSIAPEWLEPLLPTARLVYLNMMTGHDLTVEHAALLRGPDRLVYIDAHMIAYRVHRDGRREPSPAADRARWANAADILQCNEREFTALMNDGDEQRARETFFQEAPRTRLVITRAEAGADVYDPDGTVLHVAPVAAPAIVDPTGCGDAFGSVFAWGLAHGEATALAAERAARAAAFVVSIPGSRGMERLRHHLGVAA